MTAVNVIVPLIKTTACVAHHTSQAGGDPSRLEPRGSGSGRGRTPHWLVPSTDGATATDLLSLVYFWCVPAEAPTALIEAE